jgi:hypothetical protein
MAVAGVIGASVLHFHGTIGVYLGKTKPSAREQAVIGDQTKSDKPVTAQRTRDARGVSYAKHIKLNATPSKDKDLSMRLQPSVLISEISVRKEAYN